ncbi:MAG TPA: 3'-5' exonuclease [Bacteroidales bacterium]|mgnify:CR=1 FL=1|nr:3'-5' exonuclease [Bacteroidales bacterium]HPT52572.1 3'-5' exonuclease [Bacteroidales bacterium]
MNDHILSQLNDSQREAVQVIQGPVMVIAGAGSGKTRVLTFRIAYMLSKGILPYQILALTFTNKAAKEMKERIQQLIGGAQAKAVFMGTFHSIFLRILRTEAEKIGFTSALTVYDTDDSTGLIKTILKEMNLDPKIYKPNLVLSRISAAKSNLLSAEDYVRNAEAMEVDRQVGRPLLSEVFLRYNNRLHSSNAMDFDDLLYYTNALLRDFPEMLYKYQNRFRYILVDEYQDTNFAQYMIVKKIAAAHHNICVVGDDAQSIYGFRGADIHNILNFKRDYKEAIIIKLEQNYRSTQNIVNAANAIIKNNREQMHKTVWTDNGQGSLISIVPTGSETDEATAVCDSIFEIRQNYHADYKQFAILYRTNMQSRALEESLIKKHIPYRLYGGTSFYKRKEIKDILAYCRLAINHYDEESLRRVINYPARGIGETTLDRITVSAQENKVRMWDVVQDPEFFELPVNGPTKERLQDFAALIKSYTAQLSVKNAYELGKHIAISSRIMSILKEESASSDKDRIANVEELLDAMQDFSENAKGSAFNEETGELIEDFNPTLDRFMENVALLTDSDEKEDGDDNKVKLMTIHAAKGLEFDYVYITGMEENLFPSSLSIGSRRELEEERRLFYVAITRAKMMLTITHAQTRHRFGSLQFCEPSRFIDEIPMSCVKSIQKASSGKGVFSSKKSEWNERVFEKKAPTKTKNQTDLDIAAIGRIATINEIVPKLRIYHLRFGYGNIQLVDGNGSDKRAVITFDTLGDKTVLLKFAQLIIPKN